MRTNTLLRALACIVLFCVTTSSASNKSHQETQNINAITGLPEKTSSHISIQAYVPSLGDYIIVDVKNSTGYIINDINKTYTSFPVLTGQKRHVCYIGRCYFAATPLQEWYIKERNIQGDRYTFGKTGEFLRLYEQSKRTAYGFHSHKYYQEMRESGDYYRSMGCVLVSDEVLDVIEKSFYKNDMNLKVITTENVIISSVINTSF